VKTVHELKAKRDQKGDSEQNEGHPGLGDDPRLRDLGIEAVSGIGDPT
jgi:hypothetical protein